MTIGRFMIAQIGFIAPTCLGLSLFLPVAHAAEETASRPSTNFAARESKPESKIKPAAPKPDAKRAEMKKRIEEKKKDLNGSRWDILLTQAGTKEPKNDELVFQDGKVRFRSFGEMGFEASNYTISLPEGSETAVWETMQNSEKSGVLFVRGEWKEEKMSGVVSLQDPAEPEKPARDYAFTTDKKNAISPTSVKKEEAEQRPSSQEETEAAVPLEA